MTTGEKLQQRKKKPSLNHQSPASVTLGCVCPAPSPGLRVWREEGRFALLVWSCMNCGKEMQRADDGAQGSSLNLAAGIHLRVPRLTTSFTHSVHCYWVPTLCGIVPALGVRANKARSLPWGRWTTSYEEESEIQAQMSDHLTALRMATVKIKTNKTENSKCGRGRGELEVVHIPDTNAK